MRGHAEAWIAVCEAEVAAAERRRVAIRERITRVYGVDHYSGKGMRIALLANAYQIACHRLGQAQGSLARWKRVAERASHSATRTRSDR